jgi:hypothetical protein
MTNHLVSIPTPLRVFTGAAALATFAACAGAGTGTAVSNLPLAASRSGATAQSIGRQTALRYSVLPPAVQSQLLLRSIDSRPAKIRPAVCPKTPLAFISDFTNNVVYEADNIGQCAGPLQGFNEPQGMTVDKQGNLWVANTGASNVLEFKHNQYNQPPALTLNDPGYLPADVCVDRQGNVAVTNIETDNGVGAIVFYAPGAVNPTGMASNANFPSPRFCAFASNGNLAFDDLDANGGTNLGLVYAGNVNNMNAPINTLTITNQIGFPGGVQVPTWGGLAVLDQTGLVIDNYKNPKDLNLGAPISVTTLGGAGDPVQFQLYPKSVGLLAADALLDQTEAYNYPAGGNPVNVYGFNNGGLPIGVGHYPTEQFSSSPAVNIGKLP